MIYRHTAKVHAKINRMFNSVAWVLIIFSVGYVLLGFIPRVP